MHIDYELWSGVININIHPVGSTSAKMSSGVGGGTGNFV